MATLALSLCSCSVVVSKLFFKVHCSFHNFPRNYNAALETDMTQTAAAQKAVPHFYQIQYLLTALSSSTITNSFNPVTVYTLVFLTLPEKAPA